MKFAYMLALSVAIAATLIAPARADEDADFNERLHRHGMYGLRDYNAWLGKVVCKRLDAAVDVDASQSARFVTQNLPWTHSAEQSWKFVAASVEFYCPEKHVTLEKVSDNRALTP